MHSLNGFSLRNKQKSSYVTSLTLSISTFALIVNLRSFQFHIIYKNKNQDNVIILCEKITSNEKRRSIPILGKKCKRNGNAKVTHTKPQELQKKNHC